MKKSTRYTDIVLVDDILGAMVESLIERQPKAAYKPLLNFKDKKVAYKIGGRPPREIFYRKTSTFLTSLPPPVQGKQCSCQYLCSGGLAVIKCHSCAIYDPAGQSFFCAACFNIRHPWYRIPHVYTSIEKDESIEHTLKIAHRIAEAKRYEQEGADLLKSLFNEKNKLAVIADDEHLDNKVWNYGRRMLALEEHIRQLRRRIHEDTYQQSLRKSLVMDSSAMTLLKQMQQSEALKQMLDEVDAQQAQAQPVKEQVKYLLYHPETEEASEVMLAIEDAPADPAAGRAVVVHSGHDRPATATVEAMAHDYYATTNMIVPADAIVAEGDGPVESSTQVIVLDEQPAPDSADVAETAIAVIDTQSNALPVEESALVVYDPEMSTAALQIQKILKGFLARRIVSSMLASRMIRVWSPQYARDYYYDQVSGQSSWIPSKLLLEEHRDDISYVTEPGATSKWTCKTR